MNRRRLCLHVPAALTLASGLAPLALRAQGAAPVEGQHYVKLSQPVPTNAGAGKIDLIQFFWYGCPHCFAMEAPLDGWLKRLPSDAVLRRVPVGFGPLHQFHQRVFYALEAQGQLEALHRKVFQAIHVARQPLNTDAQVQAFMTAQGLDGAQFVQTMKSFGVTTKARQAAQLTEAYRIDGVPAIGVGGRYYTSAAMAGGFEQAFSVADYLMGRVRRG